MAANPTPAAFDGTQYFGTGSIFDGDSTATTLVTDGTRNEDTITGTKGNDIISGGGANDTISGGQGDDLLYGGKGNDVIMAGGGSDTVLVSSGNDVYSGGHGGGGVDGNDTLDFSLMKGNLTLDFGKHTADVGSGHAINHDTIMSFETVVGTTSGVDLVHGDHYANTFVSAGADNTFRGGLGNDTLVGGSGIDTYVITKKDIADGSVKTFENFQAGVDKVNVTDFMKGHTDANAEFNLLDVTNADGSHSTTLQALEHNKWVSLLTLAGTNVNDVGADHHHLNLADLGIASTPPHLSPLL